MIHITECPRDAMQGIKAQIPTELKIEYLNLLLQAGFDVLDFGSFVSPAAIPQMRDTAEVLAGLNLQNSRTRLLAIIANERGAAEACKHESITYLGFPFSVSETFQRRNTNAGIPEALERIKAIQQMCTESGKELLVYLSMAFGNPYGDEYNENIVVDWCKRFSDMGIKSLALADTIGSSEPSLIKSLFGTILPELKGTRVAAHLHSVPQFSEEKIRAAYETGCRHFDTAIHGFGGCPMAKDDLTGNISTQSLLAYLDNIQEKSPLDKEAFEKASAFSWKIFNNYH